MKVEGMSKKVLEVIKINFEIKQEIEDLVKEKFCFERFWEENWRLWRFLVVNCIDFKIGKFM